MTDSLLESYEAVPYDSRPVAHTEVGALEALGLLYGIATPPADRARVLELGCASGGNLIPMAYRYPNATFVGIDLTPGQIAIGREEVQALGVENITLRAMSIADITDDFGTFDYILCHGVYSWVPPEVQDAILRVASRNLSANGLAYISYNTLPGWHVRGMVREMVMYHDDHSLTPRERIARAKEFAHLIADQGGEKATVHRLSVVEEVANIDAQGDSHFLHEQLEPFNLPLYFSEFVARAESAGLRYVCEAKLADGAAVTPEWAKRAAGGDLIRAQQYVDFATGRTFRRSLLCHGAAQVLAEPNAIAIEKMYVALRAERAEPAEEDRAKGGDVESFALASGPKLTTNNPLILAALNVLLRVAPEALAFRDLVQRVEDRLSMRETAGLPSGAGRTAPLPNMLLQCAISGFVELHRHASPYTHAASERPVASAIARRKVETEAIVPNLRHIMAEVTDVERAILGDLDGTRDRRALAERMRERVKDGTLQVDGGLPSADDLATFIDGVLKRLAAVALLEA